MTKKEKKLYEELSSLIGSLPAGSKLPTIRAIMKQFSLSQAVVDKVIGRLKEEGSIVSVVGSGIYTAANKLISKPDPDKKVALIVPDYPSPYYQMLRDLVETAAKKEERPYDVIYMHEESSLSDHLSPADYCGAIIQPRLTPVDKNDIMYVKSLAIPVVYLEANMEIIGIDSVSTDNEYCGALAANHLLSQGHRRLAVLNPEPLTPVVQSRIDGFEKQVRLAGMDCVRFIDCHTAPGGNAVVNAYNKLNETVRMGELDFTGIFILSDAPALGVRKVLNENGIEVPGQVSIVGCDNIPESSFYHPALTSIDKHVEQWAEAAFDILNRRLNGEELPAKHVNILPELIIRESTAPYKGSKVQASV